MRHSPTLALALALVLAVGLSACAGDAPPAGTVSTPGAESPTPTPVPTTVRSAIRGSALEDLDVAVGSTVAWQNQDEGIRTIGTITSTGEAVESGEIAPGDTYEHRFREPGVWDLVVDGGTEIWTITVR